MNDKAGTEADFAVEEQQWSDLAKEMADYTEGEARETPPAEEKPASKTEGETEEGGEPKLSYEELDRRHRGTQVALKEARERERAAADQLKAFNAWVEEMRAARQSAKPAEKQPEPEKEIDPYEDPIGYVNAELAKIRGELQGASQQTTELREADAARREYQQFMGVVERAENEFAEKTPDYHDAAAHLEKARRGELAVMYPDTPQCDAYARQNGYHSAAQLREAIFRNDAQTVAANALRMGINPAQAYYELAKSRGYVAKAGGGSPEKKAAAAFDAVRRGQAASKTISGGSGKADKALSVGDLADLYADDPEEFDRQWDKMARAGKLG